MKRFIPLLAWSGLLLLGSPETGRGADVSFYGILKSVQYLQTTTGAPTLLSSNAYAFNAFVLASTNGGVTNATVRLPNNGPTRALVSEADGLAWRFEHRFATQAALDAAYPTGSPFSPYSVTLKTVHDGNKSGSLSFFLISSPPTPVISNLAEGQAIDTTRDFVLRWNSLGGSALDLVQVLILDGSSNVVFATPAPLQPGALNGAATSILVPAATLPPNSTLQAHVAIARPGLPATSYATGIAGLAKDTEFEMITRAAPVPPLLSIARWSPPGVELQVTGEANRVYHLQASTSFQTWQDILVTNTTSGSIRFTDPEFASWPKRFYRVQVGP